MVMQQQWALFWSRVDDTAHQALWPFRTLAESLGIAASDGRIWFFLCALFVLALLVPSTYGDMVLRRRRVVTKGKIVKINQDSDGLNTPTIEFVDRFGRMWCFDSALPIFNRKTSGIGATVPIMYDPFRPTRAREIGRPLIKAYSMILWWAIFFGLLVAVYFVP